MPGRRPPSFDEWEPRWPAYVSVGERREAAARRAREIGGRGRRLSPVICTTRGRHLAGTFWGRAWCDNLAAYASIANRLERGRRYLRGGLVIDLVVAPGVVTSLVSGTEVYEVRVTIAPMPPARWKAVVKACAGKIDSVVELLAGRLDEGVMAHVCRQETGLFPAPAQIRYTCTCPDGARGSWLCKHVAATLYGVGVRLDEAPDLLFALRRVAHADLVTSAAIGLTRARGAKSGRRALSADRLSSVFGIDLDAPARAPKPKKKT